MTPPAKRVSKVWSLFRTPLDQGNTGECVAHAWRHFLEGAPLTGVGRKHPPLAPDLYNDCCDADEFPENDNHDNQFGTSTRTGAKVLKAKYGLVSEYNYTNDAQVAADWLGGLDAAGKFVGGGLVAGVNWYSSFDTPTAEGFIQLPSTARIRGGHAFWINGWNQAGFYWAVNSWGPKWGPRNGRFRIDAVVLDRLLHENGELWTAVEVKPPAA